MKNFKKGDYIVITRGGSNMGYITNYCFKQRVENCYLQTELDCEGSVMNGWIRYIADDNSNWRFATEEEKKEYDRVGKPYDVTKFKKNNELMPEELTSAKYPSDEELLKEAYNRYKLSVKFKSLHTDNGKIREVKPYGNNKNVTFEIHRNPKSWCGKDIAIIARNGMFAEDINGNSVCSNPAVYIDGVWAEIVGNNREFIPGCAGQKSKSEILKDYATSRGIDIIDISFPVEDKRKFTFGKWYKWYNGDYILRCSGVNYSENKFLYNEYIHLPDRRDCKLDYNHECVFDDIKEEVDISVVQQYLPKGHKDTNPHTSEECTPMPALTIGNKYKFNSGTGTKIYEIVGELAKITPHGNSVLYIFRPCIINGRLKAGSCTWDIGDIRGLKQIDDLGEYITSPREPKSKNGRVEDYTISKERDIIDISIPKKRREEVNLNVSISPLPELYIPIEREIRIAQKFNVQQIFPIKI